MLDIRLFGSVEIKLNGRPLDKFISRKADALLIYLACHERPFSREQLATLFWGDSPQTKALANLSVILSSLRKQLASYIITDRYTIAFNHAADNFVDYAAFTQGIASARRKQHNTSTRSTAVQLAQAIELYRGPFLSGFNVRQAADFEAWALIEQEQLTQLAIEALDTLINFHLSREQYTHGITYAQRSVTLDPLYETTHRQLMQLYALDGQRNAALMQYETCRTILSAELGVEPDDETQLLFKQIKSSAITSKPHKATVTNTYSQSPKHNLPASQTAFIGRTAELQQIKTRLNNQACRLLTLLGPGGVGKSRLALAAARQQINTFWHGVWFVPLAGLQSEKYLPETIAEALNLTLGTGSTKSQLINFLSQKEMLLILDNFEHILEGTDLLVALLKAAPELKIIVTSRERLNIRAEWLIDIGGLPYLVDDKQLTLAEVLTFDAVDLFIQRVRQIRLEPELSPQNAAAIVRICQLVQGLPLALELAAAWTRTLSFEDIVNEIEHSLALLSTTLRDMAPRHRSIEAVFAYSWQRLTPMQQRILRQLAVFSGNFSATAAQHVTGATVADLLDLVNKSLLIQQDKEKQLFTLHMLIRQFLSTKLADNSTEYTQTKSQHAYYYANFVYQHLDLLKGNGLVSSQASIRAEFENVRQAWRFALDTCNAALLEQLHEGLMIFSELQGLYQYAAQAYADAIASCEKDFDVTNKESCRVLGKLLVGFGWQNFRLGHYQTAQEAAERSLQLFAKHDIWQARDYPLLIIGGVAFERGNLILATQYIEESAALFQRNEDAWGYSGLMGNLAEIYALGGEYERARQAAQVGLEVAEQAGSLFQMGSCQIVLGTLAYARGDISLAKSYLESALDNARMIGLQVKVAVALVELAKIVAHLGNLNQSEAYINEATDIYTETGNRWGLSQAWQYAGMLAIQRKHWSQAKQLLLQSLRLAWEIGAIPICIHTLYSISFVLADMGQSQNALTTLTFCQQHSDQRYFAFAEDVLLETELLKLLSPANTNRAQAVGRQIQLGDLISQMFTWLS